MHRTDYAKYWREYERRHAIVDITPRELEERVARLEREVDRLRQFMLGVWEQ